ncbi:MAG: hypothetical protein K2X77_13540 [Candidatus Obscuribacterales bacterium]|jgi:Flp pilus assembly protein TadG|nr:hypothetical protein [Candidatus Obscuribacterales bacterium]
MTVRRKPLAQSIIETVVGIIFLIPIVLFLFDVAVLVLSNTANDNLAKSAARAAASATDSAGKGNGDDAEKSAKAIADNFATSPIIQKSGGSFVTGFFWNGGSGNQVSTGDPITPAPGDGQVAVITTMRVVLPVPFPFLPAHTDFKAKAVEPIVSIAP